MNGYHTQILPWLLIALGICAIAIGIVRGECMVLFTKATAICLECIGIG